MKNVKTFQNRVENEIQKLFSNIVEPQNLYDPIKYVMSLGGKRIRPVLCLAGCAVFNAEAVEDAVSSAVGLEIFHNFTLLHDDLMDRSDMRRNNPTVHKKWNDNTAILSGDAMMIMAIMQMSKAPARVLNQILDVFNRTALEVCEGQQYDMDFETRNDVAENEYLNMIRLKTSVLLGGSIKIGAIIGGAENKDAQILYEFGCNAGMAFQLQDDWLDVYGESSKFGKPIGGDIVCNKKTFLLISAQNNLSDAGKNELAKWLDKKEFNRDEKIEKIKILYENAKVSKKAQEKMNLYYNNSLKCLCKIKGSKEILDELAEMAENLMIRTR